MTNLDQIHHANILVVDDQPAQVQLLDQMLRAAGYVNVDTTTAPHDVARLHAERQYDLILLDLQMPAMDGFEVMQALRADSAQSYLPVIAITAQPGHKLRALQAGARDFINKPFDLVEVETRIRNMLEVRVLYRQLEDHNLVLEKKVQERTAELHAAQARYRALTELACDWYWEQDESGTFTRLAGPVLEMLGMQADATAPRSAEAAPSSWDEAGRETIRAMIVARKPVLDFAITRRNTDGTQQRFHVSGEPIFDQACRVVGYRGFGVQIARLDASPMQVLGQAEH